MRAGERLVLDDRDVMRLGDCANLESDEIGAVGGDDRRADLAGRGRRPLTERLWSEAKAAPAAVQSPPCTAAASDECSNSLTLARANELVAASVER